MKRQRPPSPMPFGPIQWARLIWHLPNFFKLYWRLYRDRRVPWYAKAVLLISVTAALTYLLVPMDFVHDLALPFIGGLDDLLIMGLLLAPGLRWFIHLCPREVVQEHVQRIDRRG